MIVLDTDILSLYLLGNPRIVAHYNKAAEVVVTTIISRIESLRGRFDTLMKAADGKQLRIGYARLVQTESDLGKIRILPIDARVVDEFDKLRTDRKARSIGRADLLIACVALTHNATLVTRNLKHFRLLPGLQVENWAD